MAERVKLAIIGGGPAGLAAAIAAREAGVDDIVILERDRELGGILNQCIHNGFGLHTFKEELTGPEYAERYIKRVEELAVPYETDTMVLSISDDKKITAVSRKRGLTVYEADAVILAMGCRERPRGALNFPGTPPPGIYTAGAAQKLVNCDGFIPGQGGSDTGLRRHRAHHGAPHDARRREGKTRRRADALLGRAQAKYRTVS